MKKRKKNYLILKIEKKQISKSTLFKKVKKTNKKTSKFKKQKKIKTKKNLKINITKVKKIKKTPKINKKPDEDLISKVVKFQLSLKPKFNFKLSLILKSISSHFLIKFSETIEKYQTLKEDQKA
jgi:hypothetical protein